MRFNFLKKLLRTTAIVGAGLLLTAAIASAADVHKYFQTQSFNKQLHDESLAPVGAPIPMWGFAQCTDDTFALCSAPTVPGPQIDLSTIDSLTIHVNNTLSVPVSILIPGWPGGGSPVPFLDDSSRTRMQSLTMEVAPLGTADYSWAAPLKAGTYLYQSGTAPSIEVPMGLYGALIVNSYPGILYDVESVILLSEIDPLQNERTDGAEASGIVPLDEMCVNLEDYEPGVPNYPCTVDYNPTYFLVNGDLTDSLGAGNNTGQNVLLRFLNAGLRTHTPSIVGIELGPIAEDGNLYPGEVHLQSEVLLPAGKTLDALADMPAGDETYKLYDRKAPGNNTLVAAVNVGAGSATPPAPTTYAVDDVYNGILEDSAPYNGATVLFNDVGLGGATVALVSGPANGSLNLLDDGTFQYTPNPDFSGTDGFTYSATLGGNSYPAQVTLNVEFANDAPEAFADGEYSNGIGSNIDVDATHGVLGNDSDPDGDWLTAVLDAPPATGTLMCGIAAGLCDDGSFTYIPNVPTSASTDGFTYHAYDGTDSSTTVPVSLKINPVADITLNVQEPGGGAVNNYRWIVQEDATWPVDPNNLPTDVLDMLSVNFHKSYMPVVAQGCTDEPNCGGVPFESFNNVALDTSKRYYVSVLPTDAMDFVEDVAVGHTIGAAQILWDPDTLDWPATVTVITNNQPIPTAQISVFVFEDNFPTNGVPDPNEPGLGLFEITLEDAGGLYGQQGGAIMQDAFGNPVKNYLNCFGGVAVPVGVVVTCPDTLANRTAGVVGQALIKNLNPGKFGVTAIARPGEEGLWSQTSTIEGTKVQDTWVMAGEPPHLVEFGAPGYHAFIGFVNPTHVAEVNPGGDNSVSGNVTMIHPARPPSLTAFDSMSYDVPLGHTRAWVGVNANNGTGPAIAAVQANADGSFVIDNLPDGTHQLVTWDTYLDQIISYQTVVVSGGESFMSGNNPVPTWFGRHEHNVFLDDGCGDPLYAGDGIRQECEVGLPEQAVNLRFRNGAIFQSFPTDTEGFVPFDENFPFGNWLVAEVDYTRFKATGVTVTVDGGGDVSAGPYPGLLNPQQQADGTFNRTETVPAPVLLEGFQTNPGLTDIFEWGKMPYAPGENGGISGVIGYSSTRDSNDPAVTVIDTWEPGIPRVKVRLYREVERNPDLVDINVEPLDEFPTGEDVDHNGNGMFDGPTALVLVEEIESDSWDDNVPMKECLGEPASPNPFTDVTLGELPLRVVNTPTRCFDGIRNFNQVRPALFDGGYAFTGIPPGKYVVEVVPPPGYEVYKYEDANVYFGDSYAPNDVMMGSALIEVIPDPATIAKIFEPGLAQPPCVGANYIVPPYLSLFPSALEPAPFAGALMPMCNRKEVILSDQGQAAADFHLFTSTPVAGQFAGLVTDDIAIETNPASPAFPDKWGPAFLPFSIRDFMGFEVYRGYTDGFGHYNGLTPSTFSANVPIPTGYAPAMHSICLNDPGPIGTDGGGMPIFDPLRNPSYGTFCYTLMYMPGTTTYPDTPILPSAAFAAGFNPVDCALPNGSPIVRQVDGDGFGPYVSSIGDRELTIHSRGMTEVPNPAYEGPLSGTAPTVMRDYGFGDDEGSVTLDGISLLVGTWVDSMIIATVPGGVGPGTYQLVVTHANGNTSINTVSVTVGGSAPIRVSNDPALLPAPDYSTIQDAIDAATAGDLILVDSGIKEYDELVVMWKPVRLQGSGADTVINALKSPPAKLNNWLTKVQGLIAGGDVDLIPGQPTDFTLVGPGLLGTELGAGVTVLAKDDDSFSSNPSRIDGFTITGADGGGGIFVNGYAHNLAISNDHVTGNTGLLHGGIRIGHPFLPTLEGNGPFGFNTNVSIHHNAITLNGGGQNDTGAGGGLSLCTGSDHYTVSRNFICGNFSLSDGGGIGHLGLSDGGLIEFNDIIFNQVYNQGLTKSGGGLFIAGEPPVAGALTLGAGDVTVDANLIQGNQAGTGHGGGIRTQSFNGTDVTLSMDSNNWYRLRMTNNMIVNNVAAWSGGGISLQDTANASIVLNTIANNDSTATVGSLVDIAANTSTPQPAGISSEMNSLAFGDVVPGGSDQKEFSNPELTYNIVWHNRSFSYDATAGSAHLEPILNATSVGECPEGAIYDDFGVLSPGFDLNPRFSILTSTAGYHASNRSVDPMFLNEYCNGARTLSTPGPMQVAAEVVEGGNFIDVRYGPLTLSWPAGSALWNYHIANDSPARDHTPVGPPFPVSDHDFDNQVRPSGLRYDKGADEIPAGNVAFESASLGTLGGGTLDFGSLGGAINQSTITVRVSDAPVTFGSVIVTSGPGDRFSEIAGGTCENSTVATDGTCTIIVNFDARGNTTRDGTLTVEHNGNGNPSTLSLTGQ